jgi:DNA invertase Pin-like site-specific DNA recombinase
MKAASVKPVRCAIYTRVSTDHGLDQEFNSLDAQYDAASAYIRKRQNQPRFSRQTKVKRKYAVSYLVGLTRR